MSLSLVLWNTRIEAFLGSWFPFEGGPFPYPLIYLTRVRTRADPGFHWTRTSFPQGISLGSVRIPDPTSSPLLHRIGVLSHLIDILFPPDRYDGSSFPSIPFRLCIGIYTAGSIPSSSWYRWGGGGVVHAMPFRNRSRDFDARWRWCGS